MVFIAVILWLFSFSTFLGILFYARPNIAYLFGDNWISQTLYKILALIMLFIGGLAAYQFVWDLGDVGVGLMTIFNMIALFPMAPQALGALREKDSEKEKKENLAFTHCRGWEVLSCVVRARRALFYKVSAGSVFLPGSVKWCSFWRK